MFTIVCLQGTWGAEIGYTHIYIYIHKKIYLYIDMYYFMHAELRNIQIVVIWSIVSGETLNRIPIGYPEMMFGNQ